MILTVTPNTGLDRVLFVRSLERNHRNQATETVEAMGGKGCDVSLILRELEVETTATGVAAGETGRRMEAMLRRAGVAPDFVWCPGESRQNTVLIETESAGHTTICAAGLQPDEDTLPALKVWIELYAERAEVVVIAGSLPESWPAAVYAELIRSGRKGGRPIVVDATGPALLSALDEGVAAIKPNRDELESVCGPVHSRSDVVQAARRLQHRGADQVLVSLGEEGAVLATADGVWHADGLKVPTVNPAGAGDGMTACLAVGIARGWDAEETLRQAIAVSAAIVTTRGTAEVRRRDIQALLPRVQVERLVAV